jgi:hypothetical protein
MINSVITTSILRQKAEKRKYKNIAKAPDDIQIEVYRETLADLEKYLDVGDLRRLKQKSLGIIKDDVLDTINGIRDLRSQPLPRTVKSLDGTLDGLRKAKISLQVSVGMFDASGQLKEGKSKPFFNELDTARKHIEDALKQFTK